MRIDRLSLVAFGRFHGRSLDLQPGLNLIYGENESGKSTIQKFILGMLYGFKKRSLRREYTEDSLRFRPWAGEEYRGALHYSLDGGRHFRVERQFEPGRESVRLYDGRTGADLTGSFAMDRRKELLFAEEHLRIPAEVFTSTAWVGQMAVSRLEMGRELVSRVANLSESGREDVSVRQALDRIEEAMREIGSERATSKPYAKLSRQIGAKRQELAWALSRREQLLEWEVGLQEARTAIAALDERVDGSRRLLGWAQLAEAEELHQRIAVAAARMTEYGGLPAGQESGEELRLAGLHEEAARLAEMIARIDAAIAPLLPVAESGGRVLTEIERLEAAAGTVRRRLEEAKADVERLRAEVARLERRERQFGGGGWLGLAAALLGLAGVARFALGLPVAASAAVGAVALLGLIPYVKARRQRARIAGERAEQSRAMARAESARQAAEAELHGLEEEREQAFRSLGVVSVGELRTQLVRYEQLAARRDGQALRHETIRAEIERVAERAAERAAEREAILAEAEGLRAGLATLLAGDDGTQAAQEVERLRSLVTGDRPAALPGSAAIQAELRQLEQERADWLMRASDLAARVETAAAEILSTAELEREIAGLVEEKQGLEGELAALELARSVIADVSGQLHREFAPRLNQEMGRIVSQLTNGRYPAVRIDEAMAIRAIAEDDRTVEIGSLSGGTIDQFYLGLRVAVLDLLTEGQERIPLLLDDPFVQYDQERVTTALSYLATLAGERQVVLMTCHRREAEIGRAMGAHVQEL